MIKFDQQSTTDEMAKSRPGIRIPRDPNRNRRSSLAGSHSEPLEQRQGPAHEQRASLPSRLRTFEPPKTERPGAVAAALMALPMRGHSAAHPSDAATAACAASLLASSADSPKATAETERRAYPRRESGCTVAVSRSGEDGALNPQMAAWNLHSSLLKGPLLDISMNGIAFLLGRPVADGEDLFIRLSNRPFDKQIDTTARVVRITPEGDDRWKVVCKFHKNLSFEQVHDFGRHLFHSDIV